METPIEPQAPPQGQFKPDVYPLMYWGIAFGAIAGIALFILSLLARFITLLWFPVFIAGLAWGAYRNYQKQRGAWFSGQGIKAPAATPMNEFRSAVKDIYSASQEVIANESAEAAAAHQAVNGEVQAEQVEPEPMPEPMNPQEQPIPEPPQSTPPTPPV